mgnify:CR=1 FL=1
MEYILLFFVIVVFALIPFLKRAGSTIKNAVSFRDGRPHRSNTSFQPHESYMSLTNNGLDSYNYDRWDRIKEYTEGK